MMLHSKRKSRMSHLVALTLVLTLVLTLLLSAPGFSVAFAADDPVPDPGYLLIRGQLTDNSGAPVVGRGVIFSLRDKTSGVETAPFQTNPQTNAEGVYTFPLFDMRPYLASHDIVLKVVNYGESVTYPAQDGVLVHNVVMKTHGWIEITVLDSTDWPNCVPVGAGVPFWAMTKTGDVMDPNWPTKYILDGQLERTTNSDGVIRIFTDDGYLYPYDHTGSMKYIWDGDGDYIRLTPNQENIDNTKEITTWIVPLGKVSLTALTPDGAPATGMKFTLPPASGRRNTVDPGDGTVSFYAPAGTVNISGELAGDPLNDDMGGKLPSTEVTVTAWGEATRSATIQPHEPATISGTVWWAADDSPVAGATVHVYWKPNPSSPLTLLHEGTTNPNGEFSIGGVVPNELQLSSLASYTVRAYRADIQGTAVKSSVTVGPGDETNIDLYMVGDTTPPATPCGLSVTDPGDASGLVLSWAANTESDLAGYSVYRSTAVDGEYSLIEEGLTTNTYKDTTAVIGQEYWYSVTASDRLNNESARSTPASGTLSGTVISFSTSTFEASEGETCSVTLTRSGDLSTAVTVKCATQAGSARAGDDFVARTETISFAAQETSATFAVEFVDDGQVEGDETLTVNLSEPGEGVILGTSSVATLTIKDNDTNPPTTSITWPANGSFIGDNVNSVSGTATGDAGIARVEVRIGRNDGKFWTGSEWTDSETWLTASGTGTWNYNLSAAGLLTAEVEYTVDARAVDLADRADASPATMTFTFDKNTPEVQFQAPADDALLTTNQPEVTALASDSCSGVAQLAFIYSTDGSTWTPLSGTSVAAGSYAVGWGESHLPEGEITIRATATDLVGRTTSRDVTFVVDTLPPPVPTGLRVTNVGNGTSLRIEWDASNAPDLEGYVVYRNGQALNGGELITSTTITDTNLTPGTVYTYSVAARDRAGHTSDPCASQSGTPVDTTPPEEPEEPQDEPENEPEDVEPTSPDNPTAGPSTPPEDLRGASSPDSDVEIASPTGGMSLSIPAGATDTVVEFTVEALTAEETDGLLDDATPPDGFTPVGPVIEFSAAATENSEPVTSFNKPLVFELELSADDLVRISDPRKVGLYRLNDDGSLTFVGGRLVGNRLIVHMDHFSRYLVGETVTTFDDIRGHWAQAEIELMAARWVARGRPSGLFDPDTPVTRAEFAIMISRAMLLRPSDNDPGFKDVATSDYFCKELAAAVQAELVTGYDDGTFRPNASITREEMAVMIARALGSLGSVTESGSPMAVLSTFADAEDVSAWALADIAVAIDMGILRGVGDNLLAPKANATRAEAAAMVARFWDR